MSKLKQVERLCYEEILECSKCELCKLRINISHGKLPGAGHLDARVLVLGLAPSSYRTREIFAPSPFNLFSEDIDGSKGIQGLKMKEALLIMLEKFEIDKEEVYVTNLMKCSTPSNREPINEEICACFYWLDLEVKTINPEIILCLGVKVSTFFNLRPIEFKIQGSTLVGAVYHPAYSVYSGNVQYFTDAKKRMDVYELIGKKWRLKS